MRITHVSYRRLVSRPNFQHEAIEATAEVEVMLGDTPEAALDNLKKWVDKELDAPREGLNETTRIELRDAAHIIERIASGPIPF